jgi:hypothetical protein
MKVEKALQMLYVKQVDVRHTQAVAGNSAGSFRTLSGSIRVPKRSKISRGVGRIKQSESATISVLC